MIIHKSQSFLFYLFAILLFEQSVSAVVFRKIKIGIASNFSDVSSSSSNPFGNYFNDGVTLALKDRKAKLAKLGIEISLQKFDYGTDQTKVISVVKEAIASDVIAVLGYNYSSHALVAAPLHVEGKLPLITPSATATRLNNFKSFIHPTCFDNNFMGTALARIANNELKIKNVAIISAVDCAYCQDLTQSFINTFKVNNKKIKIFRVLDSDTNFSSIAKEIKSDKKIDGILVPNHEMTSAKIISAILAEGIELPFLGGDGWGNVGQEFFGIVKNNSFHGFSASHWNQEDPNPISQKFVTNYVNEFNKQPNDTAVLAYDSMSYLLSVIIAEHAFSRATLELALNKDRKFIGVTGTSIFKMGKGPKKSLVFLKSKNNKFEYYKTLEPIL